MAYASKYYDPVKAHEYYMNYTKKGLKKGRGSSSSEEAQRKSTKGLNDQGKAAAQQVKKAIAEERKAAYKLITERVRADIKKMKEVWKGQGLSKDEIKEKTAELREKAKAWREQIKALYEEKYLSELDQIKQDKSFIASGKKKKK